MEKSTTVEEARKDDRDAIDSAGRAPVQAPEGSTIEAARFTDAQGHKVRRKHTLGENLFDITTYGGFALIGNELTATAIIGTAEKGIKTGLINKPLEGLSFMDKARAVMDKSYLAFDKAVGKLNGGHLQYFKPVGDNLVSRFSYIAFAIIGGFTMVPFVKALEDSKGKLVEFADRKIHGRKADTDPDMAAAHEEMKQAPKQTWGSLMKGRALTVAAAYTVDTTFNYEHSLTAKLFPKAPKWNSLEIVSNRFTDWASAHTAKWAKLSPEKAAGQAKFARTAFGLLTFSTALTLIFYGSSKLFASRRERKVEAKEASPQHAHARVHTDQLEAAPQEEKQKEDKPTHRIAKVESLSRLESPQPELSAGV